MSAEGSPPGRDAAWVVLDTAVDAAELAAFCRDLERLYRINPFLEFNAWRQDGAERFTARFVNHSNGQAVALDGRVTRASDFDFRIDFANGLKTGTRFEIRSLPHGASLTITDTYGRVNGGPAGGGVAPAAEIDRSLHAWGVALKDCVERERRWGWLPLYRQFMRRLWLPMRPAARRVTFLIVVIGLADVLLIALGFAIYWLEAGR